MWRPRLIQIVALVTSVALLFGASRFIQPINEGREELALFGHDEITKNAPPEYAFWIQALGAFRSLIVNIAFIRAETYKEQARYYDAMQLARWICTLQPRFPSVWEFISWNMAWNISVTTYTPEERWRWVYEGVRLIRDDGLRYNPKAVNLYKQLAWTFNNKMSENIDDFHWDYKRQWAWRMHVLLGAPHQYQREFVPADADFAEAVFDVSDDPLTEMAKSIAQMQQLRRDYRSSAYGTPYRTSKRLEERLEKIPLEEGQPAPTEETPRLVAQQAARTYLRSIADAPRTLDGLFSEHPETRDMLAQLRELGVYVTDDELTEDEYWFENGLAETFFWRYRQLLDRPPLQEEFDLGANQRAGYTDPDDLRRFDDIVGVTAQHPAGQALVRFLQRKVLTEVYKLKPERMIYLVDNFGPLDWRVVDAHSLYWTTEGLLTSGETPVNFQNDKTNTARILFFSLRNLFHRNRLTFEPQPADIKESYINYSPDPNFIEAMHRAYTTYGPLIDPDPGDRIHAGEMFRSGHVNFLVEAIRMLYFADRVAEAEQYYEYLRTHYGLRPDGTPEMAYAQPLQDFVMGAALYESVGRPRVTEAIVSELILRAYQELGDQDLEAYNRYMQKALEFHQAFLAEREDFNAIRMKLRPFRDYQIDVFRDVMLYWYDAGTPLDSSLTIRKARLWRVAPPELKRWVYDEIFPVLARECAMWNFDAEKAFPEPPGMEEFRKEHPRRDLEREEKATETPIQPYGS